MFAVVDEVVSQLNLLCVLAGIIAVAFRLVLDWRARRIPDLSDLVSCLFAASTLPAGVALIACAVWPVLLQRLADFRVALVAAGLATLYIGLRGLVGKDATPVNNDR